MQSNTFRNLIPPLLATTLVLWNPFAWPFAVIAVLGILFWMIAWWLGERIPLAVTALLPILLFPPLHILSLEATTAAYGDKYVFLFLGGFLLALALEKTGLHKRFSLHMVLLTGNDARSIILGFMLASAFISMWISNTATTLMMFPLAQAISGLFGADAKETAIRNFRICLFLGIAYASSIGGMATLIGTPPNAAAAGILEKSFGEEIGFLRWMQWGLPFATLLLLSGYWVLTRWSFPIRMGRFERGTAFIRSELEAMGPIQTAEHRVLWVFACAVSLWLGEALFRSFLPSWPFGDVWVSMAAGVSLFLIPDRKGAMLLEWNDTSRLPWGILLMFGGGLALALAFRESGTLAMLTHALKQFSSLPADTYLILLSGVGLLLTAFMSNLAMVTLFVPIVGALALDLGISPVLFAIPVTLSASCDFMFPMSTPPNAIAFSSGYIPARAMFRAGLVLNLLAFLLLCGFILVF